MHFMADVDEDAEVAVVAVLHADHVPPARVLSRQPANIVSAECPRSLAPFHTVTYFFKP